MTLKLTKNQSLILGIFFANLGKSFYLRELGRMVGKEPGVFQKDINKLESDGLLKSDFRGNSRFFELNKQYPLYQEVRSIIKKTGGLEKQLSSSLRQIKGIRQAFIYGSFANGTVDNFSDVDVIIVGNPSPQKLDAALQKLEKQFNREINYSLYDAGEYKRKKKNDPFLLEIESNKKINLVP